MKKKLIQIGFIILIQGCFQPKVKDIPAPDQKSSDQTVAPALVQHEVLFDRQIKPILDENCVHCHESKTSTYNSAYSLIELGNTESSLLYRIILGEDNHPIVFAAHDLEVDVISSWIQGSTEKYHLPVAIPANKPELSEEFFDHLIKSDIAKDCVRCHENKVPDFETAKKLSNKLLTFSKGIWAPDSVEYYYMKKWLLGDNLPPASIPLDPIEPPAAGENPFNKDFYNANLKHLIDSTCSNCHEQGISFEAASSISVFKNPEKSSLYNTILRHWNSEPDQIKMLASWINGSPLIGPKTNLDSQYFYKTLRVKFQDQCTSCHEPGRVEQPVHPFNSMFDVVNYVVEKDPSQSKLYQAVMGTLPLQNNENHIAIWADDTLYEQDKIDLLKWINIEPITP